MLKYQDQLKSTQIGKESSDNVRSRLLDKLFRKPHHSRVQAGASGNMYQFVFLSVYSTLYSKPTAYRVLAFNGIVYKLYMHSVDVFKMVKYYWFLGDLFHMSFIAFICVSDLCNFA